MEGRSLLLLQRLKQQFLEAMSSFLCSQNSSLNLAYGVEPPFSSITCPCDMLLPLGTPSPPTGIVVECHMSAVELELQHFTASWWHCSRKVGLPGGGDLLEEVVARERAWCLVAQFHFRSVLFFFFLIVDAMWPDTPHSCHHALHGWTVSL